MVGKVDSMFGLHSTALDLYGRRSVVIANNIVNADTPGYQARDIDVQKVLQDQVPMAPLGMSSPTAGHLPRPASSMDFSLQYRQALQGASDKNTVNAEQEKVEFTRNAMRYSASLNFINSMVSSYKAAIRGE
jgi:flagellar basal-body rod protein FlgB